MRHYVLAAIAVLLTVSSCNGDEESPTDRLVPARPVGSIIGDTATGVAEGTWKAVQAPFEDVGLKRAPIPPLLQALVDNPYAVARPLTCEDIRREIAELDKLLGPDVCTPDNPTGNVKSRKGEYVEAGAGMAREQAVGMTSGYFDVIPFRGVVRSVSGASKHAREVARAYEAGKLRRSFLRGLAYTRGPECLTAPATPASAKP